MHPMRAWSSAWLLLLLTGGFLGLSLPLGRMATAAGVPAVTWAFLVSLGAAVLLAPVLAYEGKARWPDRRRWRYYAILAAVSYALPNLLLFTVIPKVGAGYAGIMFTLSPIMTLVISTTLRLARPGFLGVAGIGAGFAGALLVAVTRGGLGQPAAPVWIALALLIPVALAAANAYRTVAWPKGAGPIELAVGSQAVAAAMLALAALPLAGGLHLETLAAVPGLTAAQVVASGGMFAVYFRLQQVGGPVYLSQIGYVGAAVGLAFGTLAFGEHYPLLAWLGVGLIVTGVAMTTIGRR